ncbi:MAG: hypothetical protein EPN21_15100 [Methylococcaceae bacterium]|nr:MAG: hypothetical protein EPN21_15100 [Methylococcaceae bacterium]
MLTMNVRCNVPPERIITLQLPEQVRPGPLDLVMVLDIPSNIAEKQATQAEALMRLAGTVPTFAMIDGVAYQQNLRDEWP